MDLGQRLVLMIDSNDIDAGTVVTLESIINTNVAVVRYDFHENESKFKSISLNLLRPATKEEVYQTFYKKIVDKSFWIGSKWRTHIKLNKNVDRGLEVAIMAIETALNSNYDFITIAAPKIEPTVLYASALKDYCIPVNPELEESLAEELSDNGSSLYIRPGERVLYNNQVVTIIEADEEKGIIKVCNDMSNFSTTEIKVSEIREVTSVELADCDHTKVLNGIKVGDKYEAKMEIPLEEIDENISAGSISAGGIVEVKAVRTLSHYVLEDKFIVSYEDIDFELLAYDLVSYFNKL